MKRFALVALAAVSVFGCGDNYIESAQNAVKGKLNDPASAMFKDDRVIEQADGSKAVCGQVNAKNSFGGYVGFARYIVDGPTVLVLNEENASDFAGKYLDVCSRYK